MDVEDLFQYASLYRRPSGIQRAAFELQQALLAENPEAVRFCRHVNGGLQFGSVPWAAVAAVFARLAAADAPPAPPRPVTTESPARGWLLRRLYRLPLEPRLLLGRLSRALREAARAALPLPGAMLRAATGGGRGPAAPVAGDAAAFAGAARPGDVLLTLGANWNDPHEAARIAGTCARFGLRFGVLVYDVIPLRRPEWCYRGTVTDFRRWFTGTLPQADHILAISHATAADLVRTADTLGVTLRTPPVPIPLGTGFGTPAVASTADTALPPPGAILFVSTIEARKNHALLLRVWRRLLEERPPGTVPPLVFAGRVGWLVADLMQQLENAAYFDGLIHVIEDASDATIAALYRDCRLTVFPSLYEGWGLPVTESLAFGKPCIASDRTSIPEAGGGLARYVDPEAVGAWVAELGFWLDHPDALADWADRVRREFRPVPWSATARALRLAIDGAAPLGSPAFSDPAKLAAPAGH